MFKPRQEQRIEPGKTITVKTSTNKNRINQPYANYSTSVLQKREPENPELRKTVAKDATPAIGNLKEQELVNRLRYEVGHIAFFEGREGSMTIKYDQPVWDHESKVTKHFYARPMPEAANMES